MVRGRTERALSPDVGAGLATTEPVAVTVTLRTDGTLGVTYTLTTAVGPALSATILAPAAGQAPIAAP